MIKVRVGKVPCKAIFYIILHLKNSLTLALLMTYDFVFSKKKSSSFLLLWSYKISMLETQMYEISSSKRLVMFQLYHNHEVSISSTFYAKLLQVQIPKAQKNQSSCQYLFCTFGICGCKSYAKNIDEIYPRLQMWVK